MPKETFKIEGVGTLDISQINSSISKIQSTLSKIKLEPNLATDFTKLFNELQTEAQKFQNQLENGFKTKGDVTGLERTATKISTIFNQLTKDLNKVGTLDFSKVLKIDSSLQGKISGIDEEIKNLNNSIKSITVNNLQDVVNALNKLQTQGAKKTGSNILKNFKAGDIQEAINLTDQLIKKQDQYQKSLETKGKGLSNIKANREALDELKGVLDSAAKEVKNFKDEINSLESNKVKELSQASENLTNDFDEASRNAQELRSSITSFTTEATSAASAQQRFNDEVNEVKNNIANFFSLANGIELVRDALRSAFETVKELDAAMTETAVVTDFSVEDMWDQLPTYTKTANELGATTLGAYETMTLFYQQGLDQNEAFEIGTETMKMARIAGLDYAKATDLMTAALRGFNMELNETSAQRVNDVYSELAAVTASDTKEIGVAMSKTASIAASANMEFETTAAFLAQIIETTREAPETAGTAMKTIIARFTEVKELFDQGQLMGEDSEGQEININKIDEALKTVGISLKDFLTGAKGLDDILLELAGKWDSLDLATQRYIATTAAGSRQQSRFLAMMGNYDRTMELVDAAYNSTGASQAQFDKTLESLEAKLNNLANAWNAFTMGLANSDLIKGAVDMLTALLTGINNLADSLPDAAGAVVRFLAAFVGFTVGKNVLMNVTSGITNLFNGKGLQTQAEKAGKSIGERWAEGLENGASKVNLDDSLERALQDIKALNQTQQQLATFGRQYGGALGTSFNNFVSSADKLLAPIQNIKGAIESVGQSLRDDLLTQLDQVRNSGEPIFDRLRQSIQNLGTVTSLDQLQAELKQVAAQAENVNKSLAGQGRQVNFSINNNSISKINSGLKLTSQTVAQAATGITDLGSLLSRFGGTLGKVGLQITGLGGIIGDLVGVIGTAKGAFDALKVQAELTKVSIGATLAPILAVGAALAALAGIGFAAWYFSDAQKAKREMESLAKSTEAANNAAEEATNAYNELMSAFDNYNSSVQALDELTEGTQEWKEALVEVNQQVMDLLESYPELAQYVTRGENGELTISQEGQDALTTAKQEAQNSAYAMQAGAQINQIQFDYEQSQKNAQERLNQLTQYGSFDIGQLVSAYENNPNLFAREKMYTQDYQSATDDELINLAKQYYSELNPAGELNQYMERDENNQLQVIEGMRDELVEALRFGSDTTAARSLEGLVSSGEIYTYSDELRKIAEESSIDINGLAELEGAVAELSTGSYAAQESIESLVDTMVGNKLDSDILEDKLGQQITDVASSIGNTLEGDNIDLKAAELQANNTKKQLQTMYADALEIEESQIDEDIKDNEKKLAEALAADMYADELAQGITDIYDRITKTGSESAKEFFNIMSQDMENLGKIDLSQLSSEEQVINYLEDVASELGYVTKDGSANIDAFADALGISIEELTQQFSDSIDIVKEQQDAAKTGLIESMIGTGLFGNSQEILSVINQMTGEQQLQMQSMLKSLQPLGEQATNLAWQFAPELVTDSSAFAKAQALINGLDFSNPIDAAYQLSNATNSSSESVRNLATELLAVGNSALNTGEQFQYFISSAEFTEINEQLDDFIEENGSISTKNIEELARDNANLNKFLSQGKVDANALAKALNGIKLNDLDPSGFTDRVLEAMSAVTTTDEVLQHMHDTISSFDPGIDSGEGMDFLSEAYEKMQGYADSYEYGNQQFQNYISKIFGADAVAQALASENPEVAFNGYLAKLKTWVAGDGYGFWNQVGLGEVVLDGVASQLDSEGNVILGHINQETGEFVSSVNLTTEEMIQSIMDGAGVTYDTAEMLLANFLSHSTDFAKQLGENDFQAAVDELLTPIHNLGTESEKLWVMSQQELENFAVTMGVSVDEVYATVQQKAAEKNGTVKIVNWFSDDGIALMGEDLLDEIMSQLGVDGVMELLAKLDIDTTDGVVAVEDLKAAFSGLGLNEEQMNSAIDAVAQYADLTLGQEVEVPVKGELANGEQGVIIDRVTVTADSMSSLSSAINATLEAADYNLVAESIVSQDYSQLGDNVEDILSEAATNAAADLKRKVNGITFANKKIKVTPELTNDTVTINVQRIVTTTARTNTRNSYAENASGTGPKGFRKNGESLVGEEGRELIQTKNGEAYLAGTNGPEVVSLEEGDIVYSNPQTEEILSPKNHIRIKRYALGKWNTSDKEQVWNGGSSSSSSSSNSNKGSSSSSSKEEAEEEKEIWENTYDWLYNLTEDINEALRERERIERRYDEILKDRSTTYQDLLDNVYDQLDALQKEYDLQEEMLQKRTEEMQRYLKENQELSKYATFNWEDQTIEINWDEIDKVTDVDTGDRIEEYISKLEEIQEEMESANDSLYDIKDSMQELEDIGKEDFLDFEQRVMDAVIGYYQDQIDELSLIDESINDANTKLMDSIRNSVDQMRQQRENEQTEQSLSDKERRLAYLRQDTSGGNQLEIKQLEEEIANERQNYTDSLVDQKLQEFENQNNFASEQRQKQIELAQASLDMAQETGDLWKNVQELIKAGVDAGGKLVTGSQLDKLLKSQEGWAGLSNTQKMDWLKEIEQALKISGSYYEQEKDDIYGNSYNPNVDYTQKILDMLNSGNIDYHQLAVWEQQRNAKIIAEGMDVPLRYEYVQYLSDYDPSVDYTQKVYDYLAEGNYLMAAISQLQRNQKIKDLGLDYTLEYDLLPYLIAGNTDNPLLDYSDYEVDYGGYLPRGYSLDAYDNGYAYLMSSEMPTYGNTSYYQSSGDNYYEIHIDVESLSSDYDVDQIADKVKRQINEDARYRNVNAINRLR